MTIAKSCFTSFVLSSVITNTRLWQVIVFLLVNTVRSQAQNNIDSLSQNLPSVEIVATTPISGSSLNRNNVPATIQCISTKKLREQNSLTFTEFLNANLSSLHLNYPSGNILQSDLNYRGFTASPILGISQGMAVFQDGVQLNELFGNVVNWDVIPTFAIDNVELVAGSNPVFGLNALGGALSLRTKSGFSAPEKRISIDGGSFGRVHTTAEMGGNNGKLGYYVGGDFFREDGWRYFSPSQAGRFFSKGTWQSGENTVHTSFSFAKSQLHGNGPAPIDLLNINRKEVYTHPDITENQLAQLNVQWSRHLQNQWHLQTVAYSKWMNTHTFNGDETPYVTCPTGQFAGFLCEEPEENADGSIAWDKDGKKAFVSGEADASISVIDVATNQVTTTFRLPTGAMPVGVVLSPDEKSLYVANGRGKTVSEIDVANGQVLHTVEAGKRPWASELLPMENSFIRQMDLQMMYL